MQSYIQKCHVCQQCKVDPAISPCLLQPLPIPHKTWEDISMDFIKGLPNSFSKQVIWVVVDRLGKYTHFITLSQPYTSMDVTQIFLDRIFQLHGMP